MCLDRDKWTCSKKVFFVVSKNEMSDPQNHRFDVSWFNSGENYASTLGVHSAYLATT